MSDSIRHEFYGVCVCTDGSHANEHVVFSDFGAASRRLAEEAMRLPAGPAVNAHARHLVTRSVEITRTQWHAVTPVTPRVVHQHEISLEAQDAAVAALHRLGFTTLTRRDLQLATRELIKGIRPREDSLPMQQRHADRDPGPRRARARAAVADILLKNGDDT